MKSKHSPTTPPHSPTVPGKRKHAGGRPTKYKPEYCDQLVKYFDIEPHFETPVVYTNKKGITKEEVKYLPSDLPTLAGFAKKLGIHRDTIHEWSKKHAKFSDSIKYAKECQEAILVTNALHGEYSPAFSIFFAKNNLGWKDRQDITSGDEKLQGPMIYKPSKK